MPEISRNYPKCSQILVKFSTFAPEIDHLDFLSDLTPLGAKPSHESALATFTDIILYLAKCLTKITLGSWFLEILLDLIFWDTKSLDIMYPFGSTTVSSIINEGIYGIDLMKYSEGLNKNKDEKQLLVNEGEFCIFLVKIFGVDFSEASKKLSNQFIRILFG